MRNQNADLETVQCEAKVTRIEDTALFLVIRDVSERFRRFEAEKIALSEMTAREKDSEANRFTRHEVKNGLLAALGLCDSLNAAMEADGALQEIAKLIGPDHSRDLAKLQRMHDDMSATLTELDSALSEVMDTVLSEAMGTSPIPILGDSIKLCIHRLNPSLSSCHNLLQPGK